MNVSPQSGLLRARRAGVSLLAVCFACALWFVCCLCADASAQDASAQRVGSVISLDEYREQIEDLTFAIDSLLYTDEGEEAETEAEQALRVDEVIQFARAEIAAVEAVTWEGRRYEINNRWVGEYLNAYEQSAAAPPATRRLILHSLAARLQSLAERLAEGTNASRAETDAEALKQRLAGLLQQPEYKEERARGGALDALWRKLAEWWRALVEWLRSLSPNMPPPSQQAKGSRSAQFIVIAVVLAMVGFVVWKLMPLIKRSPPAASNLFNRDRRTVLGERLRPDQRARDLLAEAEALARGGDIRLAIRKGYVAFLCELAERRVLALAKHKTNRDYLEAVSPRGALLAEMRGLTTLYESHWYGDHAAEEDGWRRFRGVYEQALAALDTA